MEAFLLIQPNFIGSRPGEAFQDVQRMRMEWVEVLDVWDIVKPQRRVLVHLSAEDRVGVDRAAEAIHDLVSVETMELFLSTKPENSEGEDT